MDFLDSVDSDLKYRKSRRVRSWYLYEQYKSLERNQLDAAQKLKDKSCQDRILRQELHERRVRRKLYDRCNLSCLSDIHVNKCLSEGKSLNSSSDNFFESFCELEDNKSSRGSGNDSDTEGAYSQDDSHDIQSYQNEFKSLDSLRYDHSNAESINSVIENYKSYKDLAAEIQEKLTLVEKSIAEGINQQLETVKENIECVEKYNKIYKDDKISECELKKKSTCHNSRESDITLFNIWSKLVSFAYQLIQLNHGNCYYDYGSQFLTAVLACDVLRRGVNNMCHILQPYVSPIKYSTDESDNSTAPHKYKKRKRILPLKKTWNSQSKAHLNIRRKLPIINLQKRRFSEDYWRKLSKYTLGHKHIKQYRHSEPCRSTTKISTYHSVPSESSSSGGIWSPNSKDKSTSSVDCVCPCHVKVTNPMLKIGQYIDRLLKNIEDCQSE